MRNKMTIAIRHWWAAHICKKKPIAPCEHNFKEIEVCNGWSIDEYGTHKQWVKWEKLCTKCGAKSS